MSRILLHIGGLIGMFLTQNSRIKREHVVKKNVKTALKSTPNRKIVATDREITGDSGEAWVPH